MLSICDSIPSFAAFPLQNTTLIAVEGLTKTSSFGTCTPTLPYVPLRYKSLGAPQTPTVAPETVYSNGTSARKERQKKSKIELQKLSGSSISNGESFTSVEQEDICKICYDGYDADEPKIYRNCHHHFHRRCIRLWMSKKRACPVCTQEAIINSAALKIPTT
ncbi:unnamed protein product [Sphenostylis stenocarpa]|uniref:RING-type E3 ubiquitin transferase n=1 Tax=Sphenostylis stenocarpa TaxID=92480 RepID=A0AA86RZV6_9FABA|nr:unnamed protein product [Sphenostylis stenocarpa]